MGMGGEEGKGKERERDGGNSTRDVSISGFGGQIAISSCQSLLQSLGDTQGWFSAGTPGNGVPKVILTLGTTFKPALDGLYKKHPVCTKIRLFEIQNRNFFHSPFHRPLSYGEEDTHSHTSPLGTSILELTALELRASYSPIC